MKQQIFIGGHYSSGSRVPQLLLEQTHDIACNNIHRDYEPGFSEKDNTWVERILRGEQPPFPDTADSVITKPDVEYPKMFKEPFSLKNPDFMLAIPYIKKLFPKSVFILVVRHGVDQVLCENRTMTHRFAKYFGLKAKFDLNREMQFWNLAYKKAYKHADYILRLEDLVLDTKKTVSKLVKFLDIPYPDTSMIKKPDSMGRRFKKCSVFGYDDGVKHNYTPALKGDLVTIGKEMLTNFNYD